VIYLLEGMALLVEHFFFIGLTAIHTDVYTKMTDSFVA